MELLDRFRAGWSPPVDVLEHEQPRELVASVDINRTDALGRTVCACPAGQTPPNWLKLSKAERDSLVAPAPPPPDGSLDPGHCGFTPRNVRVGYGIENTK